MESKSGSVQSGGIGFVGLLTIVFVTLKLCKVINWSWIWVLSPIWISLIIYVVIFVPLLIWIFKK